MRLGLFLALAQRRRAATNSNRVTVSFGAAQPVTPTTYAPSVSISGGPVSITTGAPSGVTPTTYAFVVSPVQIETGSPANVTPTTYAPTVSVVTDETAPVISAAWDEANNEIDLTITEDNYPVTVRWQIRAVATAAPDQSAMLAGTGGILNGSYSASSTPDSEVIDVSSLTDATDYTLYVMVSDPAGNHSAISDDDFTYTDPTVTITTGTPSGVTPTTYAPTVSVSGGTVSITTGTPSSVTPTTYAPDVSVSGGASGNYTFSIVQSAAQEDMLDPAGVTMGSAITAGNILVCIGGERSGGDPANHTVTDTNGKTWNRAADLDIDNSVGGNEGNTRMTASTWWREVDSTGETSSTPTVNLDDGTSNGKDMLVAEIAPSATYGWTYANGTVTGSGASDWDNLNSGNVSTTGDDLCVIFVAGSRYSSDRPSEANLGFDETSESVAGGGGSNQMGWIIGVLTTSQADSGSYSGTVDTTADGTGCEGICGTLLLKDV